MANYPDLKLYVDGEWRRADGQPVINPADESVLGTVPHATRADLDDALAAAEQGFKVWSRTSPAKRAEIILEAARLMRERVEDMAIAMTLEQGKPIAPVAAGDPARLRHHRVGRTGGPPHLRAHHPQRTRHAPFRAASADRRGRRVLALELPDELAGAQGGRCAVGRLLDHPEGIGGDACRRGAAGAGVRRCRPAARRAEPGVRQAVRHLRIPDPAAVGAAGDLHRFGSGRQTSVRHGGRAHEARHHGAWRPCAGDHVRRHRSGVERRHVRRCQVAQCRTGVRLAHALLRRGRDLRPVRRRLCRKGQDDQGRQRTGSRQPDGTARQ